MMKCMNNINIAMNNVSKNNNITCSRINYVICIDVSARTLVSTEEPCRPPGMFLVPC